MIGGNMTAMIQINSGNSKNKIGEKLPVWESAQKITGWLDLVSGDSGYTAYNTKIQESTHIFLADYIKLDERIKAENSRFVDENGAIYDIKLIDDPMNMHRQLEIYLSYTGG